MIYNKTFQIIITLHTLIDMVYCALHSKYNKNFVVTKTPESQNLHRAKKFAANLLMPTPQLKKIIYEKDVFGKYRYLVPLIRSVKMKKIQIVPLSRMEEMRKYFYEYLTELSKFDPDIKFDDKGIPIYKWFDCYWTDKNRFPLYFLVDNQIAGLAMIRELGNMLYDFAEFYVCPEFRKDGNAIWFANEITNLFEGEFVFSTRFTNPRALKFWGKFALQFERNSFYDDEIWRNWTIRKNNFNNHMLNLAPIYFDLIKSGEKILEGRLNDEKRKTFNIGDTITFYKEPKKEETMNAIILNKYIFKDFEEMANCLDKKDLGFATNTKEDMINTYRTIYKREDENKYGVVIFKIKVL